MKTLKYAVLAGLLALTSGAAVAQDYPTKSIKWIVPYTPGGYTDNVTRLVTTRMATILGQSIIIENKPGANSIIGVDQAAKAAPDGYTMLTTITAHAANVTLYEGKLPFDPYKSLIPISLVAITPLVLSVNKDLPVNSIAELIAYAKANPGKLSFGSSGAGTSQHLGGELFKHMAKVDMLHVPYKGSALAMQDLLGGQLTMMFTDIPTALPYIRASKLRALGQTAAQPSPALPDVATIAQQGLPNFDIKAWYGVLAPAKTPEAIVRRLNTSIIEYVSDARSREKLLSIGMEPLPLDPERSAAFIADELKRWTEIVRLTGAII